MLPVNRSRINSMTLAFFVAGIGFFASPLPAFAACEGISNAFAYNECLAKAGPQKRSRASRARRGADPESTVRGSARYNPAADDTGARRGVRISRRHGRSRATIDPWGAIKRTFAPSRKKRRR
jgi:hypothetical protein